MLDEQKPLTREEREELKGLCGAASVDWDTVDHVRECGGFGCTPNGCPGHATGVSYNVTGPVLLQDGDDDGCKETRAQANADSKFIVASRLGLPRALATIAAQEALIARLVEGLRNLVDGLETCHNCKGVLLVSEYPTRCENCSYDCDDHEEPDCPTMYQLHDAAKRLLAEIDKESPKNA